MSEELHLANPESMRLKSLSFKIPHWMYAAHRSLFRITNGRWNRFFGQLVGLIKGKYQYLARTSTIFNLDPEGVSGVVKQMNSDGYCIFKNGLPNDMVDRLVKFSKNAKLKAVLPTDNYSKEGINFSSQFVSYEEAENKFARCLNLPDDILANKDIHQIMTDPALIAIAQDYLGTKPILGSVEMWWSFPVENIEKFASASAMKYHFDMDHVNFFNLFFYLTDVDTENGPHCFVRSSHRSLPKIFRKRGRFEDETVKKIYNPADIIEMTGKRGTVIAEDTKGLHKGKAPTKGARLILQLHFTDSLFGKQYQKSKVSGLSKVALDFMHKHPETYFPYF
jgi:hypothetical protein